jgi:hypothetical protein
MAMNSEWQPPEDPYGDEIQRKAVQQVRYEQHLQGQTQKQIDAYLEHNPHHSDLVKESWGLELLKQKANEYIVEHPDLGQAGVPQEKLIEGYRAVGERIDQRLGRSRPAPPPEQAKEFTAEDAFNESLERYNKSRQGLGGR